MHDLTEEMRAAIAKALKVAGKDYSSDAVEQVWGLSQTLRAIDSLEPERFEVLRTIPGHGTPDEVADRIEAHCFDGECDGVTVVDGELVTIRRVRTKPEPPPLPVDTGPRNRHERRAQAAQQRRSR